MTSRHDHAAGHSHDHAAHASQRRLGLALLLTAGFMIVEFAGGIYAGSLALIADAGHMLTDTAALGLAFLAGLLAHRPADWQRTYGFDRFSILAAFVNGLALFAIAGLITVEAVQRLLQPVEVAGPIMLVIAALGLAVNIGAFFILHGGEGDSLNVRAAALHVMGDMLGSVAAIVAGILIVMWGWTVADPVLSVVVAVIILRSAFVVVRDSGRILLEAAPAELDGRAIASDLVSSIPGVSDVHHVHIWSISEGRRMITLHAAIQPGGNSGDAVAAIKQRLADAHGLDHATVEVESGTCADRLTRRRDLSHAHT